MYITLKIAGVGLKIAGAIAYFTPFASSAAPLLRLAGNLSCHGAKAIGYDSGYNHNVKDMRVDCKHFIGNYIKLLSGCCSELWCCSWCHNDKHWHKWMYAENFICMRCPNPKYQTYVGGNFTCVYCSYRHSITGR